MSDEEITSLIEENRRLRKALEEIELFPYTSTMRLIRKPLAMSDIAKKALISASE